MRGELCERPLLGERSESLSGEAPQALPVEGALSPNNGQEARSSMEGSGEWYPKKPSAPSLPM